MQANDLHLQSLQHLLRFLEGRCRQILVPATLRPILRQDELQAKRHIQIM